MLNSIASYEKNKQLQQAEEVFKRQTVTVIFQHSIHIHLSIYPIYQQGCECLMQKIMLVSD